MDRIIICLALIACGFLNAYDGKLLTGKTWICSSVSPNEKVTMRLNTKDIYYANGTFESDGVMEIILNDSGVKLSFENPVSGKWRIDNDKFISSITKYRLKSKDNNPLSKIFEMDGFEGQENETVSIISELNESRFKISDDNDSCYANKI
ncbi:MAG: hypothetical protein LBB59_03255 [Campylobacteraceae bacterium]|jgi:hypothetical protein|nr:hypothetical protein [Campylobacteraceae bacterium]